MASFNKVILMGNLTRDPEVRYANSGTAIVKFGLAVNRRIQDGDGNWREEPTFVDVTIFGKRGEAFAKFHTKGKSCFIEGSLRFDSWEDKQSGQKRSKLYVVGDNWEFVGGAREGGGGGGYGGGGGGYSNRGSNDGAAPSNEPAPNQGGQSNYGGGGSYEPAGVDLDDTPF